MGTDPLVSCLFIRELEIMLFWFAEHYLSLLDVPKSAYNQLFRGKKTKDIHLYSSVAWMAKCSNSQKQNFRCLTFSSSARQVSGAERSIAQFSKFFNNRSVKRPHHSGRRASFYGNQSPFSSSKPTTCKIIQSNDDLRYTEDFFPETFGHSQSLTSQVITKLQHI